MDTFQAIVLGIVEGVTEFLPVSSTFHLLITSRLLHIEQTNFQKLFEVAIQSGAILAVLFPFIKAIRHNPTILLRIITSFIPTAIIGAVLYKLVKGFFFEQTMLQIIVFVVIGIVFILFEKYRTQDIERELASITMLEAVLIGCIQALAVVPGVSRAGAVMLGMMFLGMNRKDSALYSFYLAVPTILAASALDIIKSGSALSEGNNTMLFIIGLVSAFVSALVIVKLFTNYLKNNTLAPFGWYRIIVGLFLLTWLL